MKKITTTLLTLGATLIAASSLFAATARMDPVGAIVVTCKALSDTSIGIPFTGSPAWVGVVSSGGASGSVINCEGASFTADEFNNTHYVAVTSGAVEGTFMTITDNDATSVTVSVPSGIVLASDLVQDDGIQICKHATMIEVIPNPPLNTMLFAYGMGAPGSRINIAANPLYLFTDAYGPPNRWVDAVTYAETNTVALEPGKRYVVRNGDASDFDVCLNGNVAMFNPATIVSTIESGLQQDNAFSLTCPVPITLWNSGLGGTVGDMIFFYDNTATGYNKAANPFYLFTDAYGPPNRWVDAVTYAEANDYVMNPGEGYVFRKSAAAAEDVLHFGTKPY